MKTSEDIHRILAEVGPLDDAIAEVLAVGEGEWVVRFETVDVELEYEEQDERLVFSVGIGTPTEANRLRIYEALLLYNVIWRDTGGVRMALASRGGEAVQIADLSGPRITPPNVTLAAVNLAERAVLWRGMMASEGAEAVDSLALQSTGYMRI